MALSSLFSQLQAPANLAANPYQAAVQSRLAQAPDLLSQSGMGIGNAQLASNELSALSSSAPSAFSSSASSIPSWVGSEFQGLGSAGGGAALPPTTALAGGEAAAAGAPGFLARMGGKARVAAPFVAGQVVDYGASRAGRALAKNYGNSVGGRLAANTSTVLGDTAAGAGAGASAGSVVPLLGTAVGGLVGGTAGAVKGGMSAWNNMSNPELAGATRNNQFNALTKQLVDNNASPEVHSYFRAQALQLLGQDTKPDERKKNLKLLQDQLKMELAQPGSVVKVDPMSQAQQQMDPHAMLMQQQAVAQLMAPYLQQVQQSGNLASQVYGQLGQSLPGPYQAVAQAQAAQASANANNMAAAMAQQSQTLPYANQIQSQNYALQQLAQQMARQNNAAGAGGSLTTLPPPTATK